MRLPGSQRVKHRKDFLRVKDIGRRYDCGAFLCQIAKGNRESPRLGLVASRKIGNAVVRNRAKRIFREIFRLNQDSIPPQTDIVIIIRRNFSKHTMHSLSRRLIEACNKWKQDNEQ